MIALYVVVDTWRQGGGCFLVSPRPGPIPACSDPELLTPALAREFLGRDSERAWRAEAVADWPHRFVRVPTQSEWNRRVRCWLWRAFELLRRAWTAPVPLAPGGWAATDTTPLPIQHPSRVGGTTSCDWPWPADGRMPGFGYCAAKNQWCSSFRLAVPTGLTDGLLTRVAAKIAASTFAKLWPLDLVPV